MNEFVPEHYGPVFAGLLDVDRLRQLGPGRPGGRLLDRLDQVDEAQAFAHAGSLVDREMAKLCLGAVWLLYDDLDTSHTISQTVETPWGSFWHAIMHRREPDYSNSKYWFRQTGQHPIFAQLGPEAVALAQQAEDSRVATALSTSPAWDPFEFVDLCQAYQGVGGPEELLCQRVQQREWELLFHDCYTRAVAL